MFALEYIQDKLNFDSSVTPHFITESGAGRHGVAGLLLGEDNVNYTNNIE